MSQEFAKFKFKDKVKVTDGFYEGQIGEVRKVDVSNQSMFTYRPIRQYLVLIEDLLIWIPMENLEKWE